VTARRFVVAALVACAGALAASCQPAREAGPRAGATASAGFDTALAAQVSLLEQRRTRMEDIEAIRRLQRAYGYYWDEGLWDDVADLFADDATIEIGLDGQYRGKARVREYLRAYGGGRNGRAPGELDEYLQLMPVVTLDADGRGASGTWRAVILSGRLGVDAYWSEGPYENRYVKENGVWKMRSVHWFQTLRVPYAGGWVKNGDVNGGRFVGDRLRPDAPPTIAYKTWPGAFTPPFHFKAKSPVQPTPTDAPPPPATDAATLSRRVARLAADVQRHADRQEIENLQRIYGFYVDKGLWSEAAALFTADGELEVGGRGVWKGQRRVLDYLRAIGPEGLQPGRLLDQMQLQPIVTVADDGRSARGRWHLFSQLAASGRFHEWGLGVYENQYRREDGVWKIHRLHLFPTMQTPYEDGWAKTSLPRSSFEPALAPDAPATTPSGSYETPFVVPFHYPHPVRAATAAGRGSSSDRETTAGGSDVAQRVAQVASQLARVEDVTAIENLQMIYGYYLATLEWDALADLFADDGTIEIAMRGVYVGKPAVRRNLNLYGQAGLDDGVLHNHMQYQPVIHVADDGRTANLRSRALSMMGNFGRSGMWMGGTYENTFVKQGGVWKFHKDQQINTYFAPYETGWKDLAQRPPPGITAANPPDRPPSFAFDLYPKNFLPPFHYVNPVTGRPATGVR
jgi:hypothetical protein